MCFNKFCRNALLATLVAALVTACGGGGGGSTSTPTPTPTPAATNVLSVTVDSGPLDEAGKSVSSANALYTTVTVCQPGSTSNCQVIDHVLVDTGSTGLRLLSSQLPTSLNLPQETSAGLAVLNCVKFVDHSFLWGPVATADVMLGDQGGHTASNVPIQIISGPTYAYNTLSSTCQQSGSPMNTIATLGAKGILGVGLFLQDCGSRCAPPGNAGNGSYFSCTASSCSSLAVSTANQLQNPVALFPADSNGVVINNGLVVKLPATPSTTSSISGSIYFGVATQSNNSVAGARLLQTNTVGDITTVFQGVSMRNSFIDSGSNGLYVNSSAIPTCTNTNISGFYCPTALQSLSATMSGTNTTTPVSVAFAIDNAATILSGTGHSVFPTLGGPSGDSTSFDWGLPFFFGRNVIIGFEGRTSTLGSGTYFAF